MRIINDTQWDTRDLRAIFAKVLARWNRIDDRKVPSKRLNHVKVVNARRSDYPSGCAYLRSGWMLLRLPKEHLSIKRVGFIFEHELAHCAGYDHDRMGPLNHWQVIETGRYDYLDGMVIRRKQPRPPKPKPDPQITRYQRAMVALARWESKRKRAETAIKKYRLTIRRYERTIPDKLAALKAGNPR